MTTEVRHTWINQPQLIKLINQTCKHEVYHYMQFY